MALIRNPFDGGVEEHEVGNIDCSSCTQHHNMEGKPCQRHGCNGVMHFVFGPEYTDPETLGDYILWQAECDVCQATHGVYA